MVDTEEYLISMCTFLRTQEYLGSISIDSLRTARRREDLGITSLGVIMLVANYMEAKRLSNAEFNPDWISRLDYVDGIIAVFREIDLEKLKELS